MLFETDFNAKTRHLGLSFCNCPVDEFDYEIIMIIHDYDTELPLNSKGKVKLHNTHHDWLEVFLIFTILTGFFYD